MDRRLRRGGGVGAGALRPPLAAGAVASAESRIPESTARGDTEMAAGRALAPTGVGPGPVRRGQGGGLTGCVWWVAGLPPPVRPPVSRRAVRGTLQCGPYRPTLPSPLWRACGERPGKPASPAAQ